MTAPVGEAKEKPRLTLGTGVFLPRTGQVSPHASLSRSKSSCKDDNTSSTPDRISGKKAVMRPAAAQTAANLGYSSSKPSGMGNQTPAASSNPLLPGHGVHATVHRSMSLPARVITNKAATRESGEDATTSSKSSSSSGRGGFTLEFENCMEGLELVHSLSEPLSNVLDVVGSAVETAQPASSSSCSASSSSSSPSSSAARSPVATRAVNQQLKETAMHTRRLPAVQQQQTQPRRNMYVTPPPPPPPRTAAAAPPAVATAVVFGPLLEHSSGNAVSGYGGACIVRPTAQQLAGKSAAAASIPRDNAAAHRVHFTNSSLSGYSTMQPDMDMLSSSFKGCSPADSSMLGSTLVGCSPPCLGVLSRTASECTHHTASRVPTFNQLMPVLDTTAAATAALGSNSFAYDLRAVDSTGMDHAAAASEAPMLDATCGDAMQLQHQKQLLAALQNTSSSMYGGSPLSSGGLAGMQYPALSSAAPGSASLGLGSNMVGPQSSPLHAYLNSNASHGLDLCSNSSNMIMGGDALLQAHSDTQLYYSGSCVDSGTLNTQLSTTAAVAAATDLSAEDDQLEAIERQLSQLLQLHQQVSANKAASATGLLARRSLPTTSSVSAAAPTSAEALAAGMSSSLCSWEHTATAVYNSENSSELGRLLAPDGSSLVGCFELNSRSTAHGVPSSRLAAYSGPALTRPLNSACTTAVARPPPAAGVHALGTVERQGSQNLALQAAVQSAGMQQAPILGGLGDVYAGITGGQQQQIPAMQQAPADEQQKRQYMRLAASKLEQLAAIQEMQAALQEELRQLLP